MARVGAVGGGHRRARRAAGGLGDAECGTYLQPVHLLPLLMSPMQRFWDRVLIAVFVAAIVVPGIATLAGIDRPTVSDENRTLAPFPTVHLSIASLTAFPDAFTRYFEDNFSFRARL